MYIYIYIYIYIYTLLVFDEISFVSVSFILILFFFLAFFPVSISNNQVEKLKHDEKETKKLQDSLQSLQLRLAAREHMCRTLQEKVILMA
jgi:hypothetical protein